jgi:hypothetical protein
MKSNVIKSNKDAYLVRRKADLAFKSEDYAEALEGYNQLIKYDN